MNLTLMGAAREVGRSGVLVELDDTRFLFDYGVKLQDPKPVYPLPIHGYLDFVILSHAHLDHSGGLPLLFKGREPRIFTPTGTQDLTDILLRDFLKIARMKKQEVWYENHLKRMKRNVQTVDYEKETYFGDISFTFFDAGHILGAGMTYVDAGTTMVYSGDYKDTETKLHSPAKVDKIPTADVLVVETTYGNREHPDRKALEKEFISDIRSVIESGGRVILPAFAVGRAQEIVEMLYANNVDVPVYLDGMAQDVSEVYLEYPELLRDYEELYNAMKWVNWIADERERKRVFDEPGIVVTTAGMLNGGPALYYLLTFRSLGEDLAVFLTGYQVEGTPGRQLLETKTIEIDGNTLDFSDSRIKYFDFSAHCDMHGIFRMIDKVKPQVLILNHGDPDAEDAVRQKAEDRGAYVFSPKAGETIDLSKYVKR